MKWEKKRKLHFILLERNKDCPFTKVMKILNQNCIFTDIYIIMFYYYFNTSIKYLIVKFNYIWIQMVLISFNEVRRTMIYPLLLMFFSIYSSFVLKKSGSIFGEMDMSSIPDSEKENYSSIMTLYYMIIITTLMYL